MIIGLASPSHAADYTARKAALDVGQPAEPVVFDADNDGQYEAYVSGATGKLQVFNLIDLTLRWERQFSDQGITGMVIGDFLGTGAYVGAVAGSDAKVHFFHPGDGTEIAHYELPAGVSLDPSVIPLEKRAGGPRDGLIVCDDSGTIHLLSIRDAQVALEFKINNAFVEYVGETGQERTVNIGRISQSASVGDVNGDKIPEIIVGTVSGGVQAVPIHDPSLRYWWRAPQGTNISTNIVAADFFKTGSDALAFGTTSGELYVLTFDADRQSALYFRVAQKQRLLGPAHGHLIAGDFDGDGYPDLAGASNATLASFDGAAQMANFAGQIPFATHSTPISYPSIYQPDGAKPCIIVGDSAGTLLPMPATLEQEPDKIRGPETLSATCPAGNLLGNGTLSLVSLTDRRSRLTVVETNIPVAKDTLPTLGYGVNFQRDGRWDSDKFATHKAAAVRADAAFEAMITRGTEALQAGRGQEAEAVAREARAIRPADPKTATLLKSTVDKYDWLKNLGLIVAALAAAGGAGFVGLRVASRRKQYARASASMAQGDFHAAIRAHEAIIKAGDRSPAVLKALADAYVQAGRSGPEVLEILRDARDANPNATELTPALAQAYAEAGVETPEALEVYQIALATLESGRGAIGYHAGNILLDRGDTEQSQKYFRTALRDGFEAPDIHEKLAFISLKTRQFTEKALPHLEAVHDAHQTDPEFLDGLCRAYAAARRLDGKARVAYAELLQLRPDSPVALRQMAKCEISEGRYAEGASLAERALKQTPKDAETIGLLAQCFVALGRTGEEALTILKQAISTTPNQPDLLRAAGLALIERGVRDDEEFHLLKQAAVANNKDHALLTGLATVAEERKETQTVIKCLERARALGVTDDTLTLKLAQAYAEAGVTAPEAEAVYKEALRSSPDESAILRQLGLALAQQGSTDAAAMLTLEKVFQTAGSDPKVGRQLARAYLQNERYDDAVKLIRWLVQQDKDDPELQKLFAEASLRSNRVDEAIRQYEQFHKAHPADHEATVKLAMAYSEKQSTEPAAAAVYEEALAIDPAQPSIRILLGRHHALGGRVARGLEEFRQAMAADQRMESRVADEARALIEEYPDRSDLRWFLCNLLVDRNNLTEALEQLEEIFENDPSQLKPVLQALDRVLAKDPGNHIANLQKGMLLKAQGHFEEARTYLEKSHKANPQHADSARELEDLYEQMLSEKEDIGLTFDLGKLCYNMKEFDKAIGHFQKTIQDFRYENESIKQLGLCFVEKGMLEFALQEFRKLVIDDDMKAILYDLARRYEGKNDIVGAKQVYRMLFAADINYKDVKTKFEQLAGNTSDPLTLDRTELLTQLGEKARRRYELLEELGRGAMGIVYKAKDKELDEVVALKILPDNLSQSPEAIQRFRAEARSARRLAHPNIVRIHDIGEELGRKFISMEFVDGTDLKRHLKANGPLPVEQAVEVMRQVARALDYAHSMGIVHRDIKPANIMLADRMVVKVSDFGIAKMLESTSETLAGAIIGTPMYMSPEQVQGHPVDNGADIYSLGIMMYELVAGRPPFASGDLAYQHINVVPAPLAEVHRDLASVIMKSLEKLRTDRWASAGHIVRALDEAFGQSMTNAG